MCIGIDGDIQTFKVKTTNANLPFYIKEPENSTGFKFTCEQHKTTNQFKDRMNSAKYHMISKNTYGQY
jgi:hypothetical protein